MLTHTQTVLVDRWLPLPATTTTTTTALLSPLEAQKRIDLANGMDDRSSDLVRHITSTTCPVMDHSSSPIFTNFNNIYFTSSCKGKDSCFPADPAGNGVACRLEICPCKENGPRTTRVSEADQDSTTASFKEFWSCVKGQRGTKLPRYGKERRTRKPVVSFTRFPDN